MPKADPRTCLAQSKIKVLLASNSSGKANKITKVLQKVKKTNS
jgi:hypothetical protein